MTRDEYLLNPAAYCRRGFDLPQTKLPPSAIIQIRRAADRRNSLRKRITERLSNAALAKKWGVHERTIEKVLSYETGKHVIDNPKSCV